MCYTNVVFIADPHLFHVVSTREDNGEIYRVHSLPAHDQWRHRFDFAAYQSWRSENDTMMFIYAATTDGHPILSPTLYLHDSRRFPYDFFIANRSEASSEMFELALSSNSSKISISNKSQDCCSILRTSKIPVILLPGEKKFAKVPVTTPQSFKFNRSLFCVSPQSYGNTKLKFWENKKCWVFFKCKRLSRNFTLAVDENFSYRF